MFEVAQIGLLMAFLAGVISFLSPCVLPLVPGYISFIAGRSAEELMERPVARLSTIGLSFLFVLGFSSVFIAMGASASWLGQLLLSHRDITNLLGGGLVVLFGLMMIGLVRLPFLQRDYRFLARGAIGNPLSAFVLGVAFAFGWTPCIGPVLGAILTVGASGATSNAVTLLAVYSAGLAVPFMLTAAFTGVLVRRLSRFARAGVWLYRISGLIIVIMGLAIMTGLLTQFASWLLIAFPVLARIG